MKSEKTMPITASQIAALRMKPLDRMDLLARCGFLSMQKLRFVTCDLAERAIPCFEAHVPQNTLLIECLLRSRADAKKGCLMERPFTCLNRTADCAAEAAEWALRRSVSNYASAMSACMAVHAVMWATTQTKHHDILQQYVEKLTDDAKTSGVPDFFLSGQHKGDRSRSEYEWQLNHVMEAIEEDTADAK